MSTATGILNQPVQKNISGRTPTRRSLNVRNRKRQQN